jgi:translation initiation factor 6 (eIF-6)
MKTPTIIVRLIGIYLLTTSTIGLIQISRQEAVQEAMQQQIQQTIRQQTAGLPHVQMQSTQMSENPLIGEIQIYSWIGIVVGLTAIAAAGFLARLLTFDAEPKKNNPSLRDQLL